MILSGLPAMVLTSFFFFLLLLLQSESNPPFACDSSNSQTASYAFCKASLPISLRAKDLVSRLTLDEKISQLVNSAPSIPRLGIPAYEWWSEALHGVANAGLGIKLSGAIPAATSFPQVILTAASFDSSLWYRIGQVIGTEARGVYNAGQATGMTFWAPNINIFRDPRWGRGQETPGEDPSVTGKYAVAFVRGVQGDSFDGGNLNGHLQASACCKHFTAYDLDDWNGVNRFKFDAKVTQQDLADTYQPPFESCIKIGRASGIMCAYNRVNGVPSCADFNLLSKTARGAWGFHGYITSDCDAVSIIHDSYGYAKSPEDAVADALNAGMDVNCGSYLQKHTKSAVEQRKVGVSQVDRALQNLFAVRMRLGLFDGNPVKLPYGYIGPDSVCSKEHQNLALEAARNGIVLLKNYAKLLPFPKSRAFSLAVIGPNANSPQTLLGNYYGIPCKSVTPLQALRGFIPNTIFQPGCEAVECSSPTINEAVGAAKTVDYVVMFMGLDQTQEREAHDRTDLSLPGMQVELIKSVARVAKRPIVLVLLCGGPVDISFAKYDPKIGSVLWAGYPGEAGGTAIADILFGYHNPGGRLPVTWYPQEFVKVPMTDMRMRPDRSSGYPGRTYRFYNGPKVFEFGYGLSYSNYLYKFTTTNQNKLYMNHSSTTYETLENSETVRYKLVSEMGEDFCNSKSFEVTIGVKNDGEMPGKHPVLLFQRKERVSKGGSIKQLVGFESVSLEAGESSEIRFVLRPCEDVSRANEDGEMVLEEGTHFLAVGGDVEHQIDLFV